MPGLIKDVAKKFSTYGLGNILQTALRFILIPLYLRYFLPEEYGVISVLSVLMGLISIFMGAGTMNGLVRLYYENEADRRRMLVGTTWLTYLVLSLGGGLLLTLLAPSISSWMFQSAEHAPSVRMLAAFFLFNTMQQVPMNILRLENRAGGYVGVSLLKFILDFGLKYLFIVVLGRGVLGYFETSAIVGLAGLAACIVLTRRTLSLRFNRTFFGELVKLGSPYIISGFAVWVLEVSDRLILNMFKGTDAVGIYSLGYSFANMFGVLLASPVGLLLDPYFFGYAARRSEQETKILLRRIMTLSLAAGGLVYLAITLGSGDLLRIFTTYLKSNERYLAARDLIPILSGAPLLYFLSTPATLAGLLIKKPAVSSVIFAASAGLNAGLSFLLIPPLGTIGAALATFLAYFAMVVALYVWIERAYPVGYPWARVCLGLLALGVLGSGGALVPIADPFVSLFLRGGLSIVLFVGFAAFVLPVREDRRLLLEFVRARARRKIEARAGRNVG
jgi:O-antigen/teichoic acid export membrane protein